MDIAKIDNSDDYHFVLGINMGPLRLVAVYEEDDGGMGMSTAEDNFHIVINSIDGPSLEAAMSADGEICPTASFKFVLPREALLALEGLIREMLSGKG